MIKEWTSNYKFIKSLLRFVSSKLAYTYEGDELLSLFISPTRDKGFSMGFTDPAFKNIHFTIYYNPKDNRIHSHITDKSKRSKPYSQVIDAELYAVLVQKLTKNWVVPSAQIEDIYGPTEKLRVKIDKITPKKTSDKKAVIPFEFLYSKIKTDLSNKKRWKKIPLRELPSIKDLPVLTFFRNKIHFVFPISNDPNHVLCFTELQHKRFLNHMLRIMGIDIFYRYLDLLNIKRKDLKSYTENPDKRLNDSLPNLKGISTNIRCEYDGITKIVAVSKIVGTVEENHDWDSSWTLRDIEDSELYKWHKDKMDALAGKNELRPFNQNDALSDLKTKNIELFELNGKYYVGNGQHRVATAHIMGLKRIKAIVRHCEIMKEG